MQTEFIFGDEEREVMEKLFSNRLLWSMIVEEIGEYAYDIYYDDETTWDEVSQTIEDRIRQWSFMRDEQKYYG